MKPFTTYRLGFVAVTVFGVGALNAVIATPANAGAPNYECVAKGLRIGIDQHRHRALVRWGRRPTELGSTKNDDQNGERLRIDIVTTSGVWEVEVTGFGKSVSIDGPAGKLTGTCTNVAGNLVLAQTTRNITIRSLVSKPISNKTDGKLKTKSKAVFTVPKGTFVWNAGNFDPTNNTLGQKNQFFITVVNGLPMPMNHMNMTGSQGWVPASAVDDVCGVVNRKPGWDSTCS
jgi:hypothetical protein